MTAPALACGIPARLVEVAELDALRLLCLADPDLLTEWTTAEKDIAAEGPLRRLGYVGRAS